MSKLKLEGLAEAAQRFAAAQLAAFALPLRVAYVFLSWPQAQLSRFI